MQKKHPIPAPSTMSFRQIVRTFSISTGRLASKPQLILPQPQLFRVDKVAKTVPEFEKKRIVPRHPTFYAANPQHEMNMMELEKLLRKYITLPYDNSTHHGFKWVSIDAYRNLGGGSRLKIVHYQNLTSVLNRLASIDKKLVNDEILAVLRKYQTSATASSLNTDVKHLDRFGRAMAQGKRKSSIASVYLVKGTGQFLVNEKPLNAYFSRLMDRIKIAYPLQVVESEDKYNVFAMVKGGGVTGQSGAIREAISKALLVHNPLLKKRLRSAGCLKIDRRVVERKKPGLRKARKAPTWVKR